MLLISSFLHEIEKYFKMLLDNWLLTLISIFHSELSSIVKIGEGTYGEAFKAGETVCKVVPIDGDLLVNGEVQKVCKSIVDFL